MEYTYDCQPCLEMRRNKIIPIPEGCVIDPARLNGLSNDDYVSAFRKLQSVMSDLYQDAIDDPSAWGYSPDVTGTAANNRITDLLEAWISEGEVVGQELHVSVEGLKNKIKKHKKNKLMMEQIGKYGFEIVSEKGADCHVIRFPECPDVLRVLQSYIQAAWDAMAPTKPTLHGGMKSLVGCFFYRLVEDKQYQKYDTIFHVMTESFTEEARQMCVALYEEASRRGCAYVAYFNECYHQIDFSKFMYLMFDFDTKEVYTRMILHKLVTPERIQLLYDLPAHLQESFKASTCTFCGGSKSPDKPCNMRICYAWQGEEKQGCAYHSFKFPNLKMEDLPYLYRIYDAEFNKK